MSNHDVNDLDMEDLAAMKKSMSETNAPFDEMSSEFKLRSANNESGDVDSDIFQGTNLIQQPAALPKHEVLNTVPDTSNDWIDSLLPVPILDPSTDIRANAFAQFVQGWESYMNDDGLIDPFPNFQQPMQMLHGLSLCGHPTIVPRIEQEKAVAVNTPLAVHPVAPSVLRYTYSSPSQIIGRKSSVFDSSLIGGNSEGNHLNDHFPPPPVALDPFQRSSSTPSAFRQHSVYSAFGTRDRSAFTTTSPRFTDFVPVGRESSCFSAFGPVDFYSMALEDMERTSIEVQDISDCIANSTAGTMTKDKVGMKRGAASRAAKFLKDIRVLRRRRKTRGGRENPVQPALDTTFGSKSSDDENTGSGDNLESRPIDTAVTVFTETIFNPNDTSFLSRNSEISAIDKHFTDVEDDVCTMHGLTLSDQEEPKETTFQGEQQYQQLDSDVEEEVGYQRVETQLQSSSPTSLEMTDQNMLMNVSGSIPGESTNTITTQSERAPIKVKVTSLQKPRFAMSMEGIAASPSPTQMDIGENNSLTPTSHESADISHNTMRSVSSSGHTTQATLPSNSTGVQSGLSTISETDREVMEANKDAKRRRGLESLVTKFEKSETDGSSNNSSSSLSTNPHRYFSLSGSPDVLRDGAVVPVDRFFTRSPSLNITPMSRANTTSSSSRSRRSESTVSPTTTVSIPVTHASSSSGSMAEEPPTFVTYIDQESPASKVFAFREKMELSTKRTTNNDREEREASPSSEILIYNNISLDELTAPSQLRGSRFDRKRSNPKRPPRVPQKSVRSLKTPPPIDMIPPSFYQHLSPPRKIIDLPCSSLSRPQVLRSSSDPLPSVWNNAVGSHINVTELNSLPVVDVSFMKSRTYQERNVEILDVSQAAPPMTSLITPEKS